MTKLGSGVFDDDQRSLAVARHWGFEIEKHAIESSLALADVASLPQSPLPPGVTLHEVPDLQFAGCRRGASACCSQARRTPRQRSASS